MDESNEVVYIIEVKGSWTTSSSIIVSNNISCFSPEFANTPKCTLGNADTLKDLLERQHVVFIKVDSGKFDIATDFAEWHSRRLEVNKPWVFFYFLFPHSLELLILSTILQIALNRSFICLRIFLKVMILAQVVAPFKPIHHNNLCLSSVVPMLQSILMALVIHTSWFLAPKDQIFHSSWIV